MLESLMEQLRSYDPETRERAIEQLTSVDAGQSLARAVENYLEDPLTAEGAAEAMGRIGDPRAIASLLTALSYSGTSMCRVAAEALVKIGPPSVRALIDVLKDTDSEVRRLAAWALGKIGDPGSCVSLLSERVHRECP
jgi:bilin biosynthesis protein